MRVSFVALAAIAAATSTAGLASNQSLVFGHSGSEDCYRLALAHRHDPIALNVCNDALRIQDLSSAERVATLVNRGIVYMFSSQSGAASSDFDSALAIDPHQPEAWLNKGINQFRLGDAAGAMDFSNRALAYGTVRPAVAYFIRGLAQEKAGNVRAAYNDLVTARRLDPTWNGPAEQLTRYRVN